MSYYVLCEYCKIEFLNTELCPNCGRNAEGYSYEELMKIRPKKEIYNEFGIIRNRSRRKSKKQKNDPMPGRSTNIRWSR